MDADGFVKITDFGLCKEGELILLTVCTSPDSYTCCNLFLQLIHSLQQIYRKPLCVDL